MKRFLTFTLFLFILTLAYTTEDNEDWYRTQVGTGTGNCGPASVSMSIIWSTEYDPSVERVRSYIGYTRIDGATDYLELASALRYWEAPYNIEIISSLHGLIDLVERRELIVIVLIDTAGISYTSSTIFGKNYNFSGGHYIVLTDVISNYFVVQDPIPPGSDRRYHIDEIWKSLKDKRIIIVRNYNI